MNELLYPDPSRSDNLLNDLIQMFSQQSFVRQVMIFGSRARAENDRWSDLDVIFIINQQQDFKAVYEVLRQHKPIVHHNPLTSPVEPCGGHLLGVVFQEESVFHNLDLNLLSVADYQSPNALQRFGATKTVYQADKPVESVEIEPSPPPTLIENPDEIRIGHALHWTKKAIKKALRQAGSSDDVKNRRDVLQQVLEDYPEDLNLPNGDICHVAKTYLQMADLLLNNEQGNLL